MILGFLFLTQTFLKYCKALSTEKYRCYINIFFIIIYYLLLVRQFGGLGQSHALPLQHAA